MHSAKFVGSGVNRVRVAMNFRWCRNEKWFYGSNHPQNTLRWACANHLEIPREKIQWEFLLEGREQNYDRDEWEAAMCKKRCTNQYYFENRDLSK